MRSGPGKNPVHLDLRVDDVDAEVTRLRGLGATVEWTIDETADGGSRWTTMSDPQGTLFCVCTARPWNRPDPTRPIRHERWSARWSSPRARGTW
ncbi:MAG: VOC family protein [Pseudonocardiaceae bacterium]